MDEIKKNTIPKWLQIFLLVGGVILVVIGLFKIFGGSNAYVGKFNELQTPNVAIKDDLTSVSNLLIGVGAKEANKDYAGIISDLQTALAKLNDVETKVASTSSALTSFQDMVNGSSDQNVKTAGARFIDAFKARNAALLKMVSGAKDLVNQAATYYNEVANNQKVTIDEKKFTATVSAFTADQQSIINIGAQYDAAASDFAKAAGFTLEKK